MRKIIHILSHNIEDFIADDYQNFDHHSIRFLEKVQKFSRDQSQQELWILTKEKEKITEFYHQKGFKIRLFPISINLPLPLEISFSLLKEVIKFKPLEKTIWHLHSYYLFMYDFLAPILFFKKQKFLMHYRGGGPSFTPKATLYTLYHYLIGLRITLNLANFVLVQNQDEKRRVINFLKVKKEKIFYFPNALSTNSVLNPQVIKKGTDDYIKLVIAGRIEKFKKRPLVIQILQEVLLEKNCKLEIIGIKQKDEFLIKLKKQFPNQVTLIPWLKREDLLKKFQKADLYLHLNTKGTFEGSPATLIEAQSQGLPGLAFDIEGVRDVIKNGYNGWLVKNHQEFKERLKEVIENSQRLLKMRLNSLNTIKDNFLDEKYFPQLIGIYHKLSNL